MNRPTDDSTRSNEQVKAVLEMLRDEGRLAAETDVSGEDARENRRTTRTSAKKGDKKSVLIVDDVACVRKFHAGQIGRLGYQSIEAGEGTEALRLYGENHAGIQGILLDLMMPVMDGYSTANEIRALEEKQDLRRMPIIAVTSLTDQEMKANSKSTAFDGHVDKPTSMSKLATIFESMRMVPDVSPLDMRSIVASKDAETAPHGLKRLHRSKTTSSSNITSDKNDSKNGSNEGSEEKCQRGSDSNGDARSSGDSGNNLTRLDGLDNSAKRPNDRGTNSKEYVAGDGSNDGSSDASRQGSAHDSEEKSTMDKTANQNRPQKANAAHVKAQAAPVNIPSPDSEAPIGKGGNAPVPAPTKTDPKSKDDPKAKDATKKTAAAHVHRSCARCGSDETRFCYYNNGLTAQPRYFCRSCQRYWTEGGAQRNLTKGSGRRKDNKHAPRTDSQAGTGKDANRDLRGAPGTFATGSQAQNEMQRAIMVLMTQVVGFDVDHAANNAGMVASRAGEEVAHNVLQELGHSSEAIEMAMSLAKTTGWRIGISVSAVATAAVSQGMNQSEIASLISTQLPFLANTLVREVTDYIKSLRTSGKSPSGESNDSGGSGGTAENGGKSSTSAQSNATATGVRSVPSGVLSQLQALQTQLMQGQNVNLSSLSAPAGGRVGEPITSDANAKIEGSGILKPTPSSCMPSATQGQLLEPAQRSAFSVPTSMGAPELLTALGNTRGVTSQPPAQQPSKSADALFKAPNPVKVPRGSKSRASK